MLFFPFCFIFFFFFFQAEDGIRDLTVTGVQTCALPISAALAATGFVAVVGAWFLVRARVMSVWVAMGLTFTMLAVLSLGSGRVRWATRVDLAAALAVGLGSGAALYVATAAFFRITKRWDSLRRQTLSLYQHRQGI